MSTEKEFDELLRSKFDEQEFPFDEANWDQAENMIDRKRKKEKRRRWFFIYFIGMMTGICVMLPFLLNTKNDTSVAHADTEKTNTHKTTSNNKLNQIDTLLSADLTNKMDVQNNNSQTNFNANHTSNQNISQKSDSNKNSAGQKNNTTIQSDYSKNQNGQLTSNQHQTNNGNNSNNTSSDKTINTANTANTTYTGKTDTTHSILTNAEKQTYITTNQETNDKDSTEKIMNPVDTTELSEAKMDSIKTENDSVFVNHQNDNKVEDSIKPFVPLNTLSLFGGLAFSFGTNYNDTISGRGFSPSLGVIYEHHWKEKIAFSAGLLYHFTGKMNYNQQESISHHPSFGLNDSVVSYSMKRFHFFNVPIQFILYLNQKNSIGLGGNFSFTAFSVSTIESRVRTNSGTTVLSERNGLNYLNGYKRYDAMLNLSYRRKFGERWAWYTDFNFGLIDYADNSVFATNANKFERNIFVQTGITFNILKP